MNLTPRDFLPHVCSAFHRVHARASLSTSSSSPHSTPPCVGKKETAKYKMIKKGASMEQAFRPAFPEISAEAVYEDEPNFKHLARRESDQHDQYNSRLPDDSQEGSIPAFTHVDSTQKV